MPLLKKQAPKPPRADRLGPWRLPATRPPLERRRRRLGAAPPRVHRERRRSEPSGIANRGANTGRLSALISTPHAVARAFLRDSPRTAVDVPKHDFISQLRSYSVNSAKTMKRYSTIAMLEKQTHATRSPFALCAAML